MNCAANSDLPSIAREAKESLAGCDAEGLEDLAEQCERLEGAVDGGRYWSSSNKLDSNDEGIREIQALGRLLELTRENLRIARRSGLMGSFRLGYSRRLEPDAGIAVD